MNKIASLAAAVAIFASAGLAASAANAGPFFHPHGYWGGPHFGGGLTIVAAPPVVSSDCYTVRRKVFVPGAGVVVRRAVVCG